MEAIRGATSTSICVCERWPGIDTQIFLYEFMVDCVRIHIYGLILQLSGFSIPFKFLVFSNGELHSKGWTAIDQ